MYIHTDIRTYVHTYICISSQYTYIDTEVQSISDVTTTGLAGRRWLWRRGNRRRYNSSRNHARSGRHRVLCTVVTYRRLVFLLKCFVCSKYIHTCIQRTCIKILLGHTYIHTIHNISYPIGDTAVAVHPDDPRYVTLS